MARAAVVQSSGAAATLSPQAATKSVTFKNGSATFATITQTEGSGWKMPTTDPTKSGYFFAGWYSAESGGVRINAGDVVGANPPATLYAQFGKIEPFYVVVEDTDGDGERDLMTFTADPAMATGTSNQSVGTITADNVQDIDYYICSTGDNYSWDNGNLSSPPWWKQKGSKTNDDTKPMINKITVVRFDQSFKNVQPVSIGLWFDQFKMLTTFEHMEYMNTTYTKNFSFAFSFLPVVTNIDLSPLDMSGATDTSHMFRASPKLASIDLSGVNMSAATTATCMFYGCTSLSSLNTTGMTMRSLRDASSMFYGCSSLSFVDLSSVQMSTITNANSMFYGCSKLKTIVAPKGATLASANCTNAFYNTSALVGLGVDASGVRSTTTWAAKRDTGATYAKVRTKSQEGYLTAADENSSRMITYHYNADGLDLTSTVRCLLKDIGGSYPTISSAIWPRTGYTVTKWNTAADGSGQDYALGERLKADLPGNIDLYQQWSKNSYDVSYDGNGGTTTAASAHAGFGDSLTMPDTSTTSRPGYSLAGWALTPTATTAAWTPGQVVSDISLIDGDQVKLYAVWNVNTYRVTFDGNQAHGGAGAWSRQVNQTYGATYVIPGEQPAADSTHYFSGWYTEPEGGQRVSESTVVRVTEDTTLYAQYGVAQDFYCIVDDSDGDGHKDRMVFSGDASMTAGLVSDAQIRSRDGAVTQANVQEVDYYICRSDALYSWDNGNITSPPWWKQGSKTTDYTTTMCNEIRTVSFDPSFKDVTPRSIGLWFNQFYALTGFENVEYLNSSRAERFDFAFSRTPSLTTVDFSNLDTSSARVMTRAFWNSAATSIDISGWNLSNVIDFSLMFFNCPNLTHLNTSGVVAPKAENTSEMFESCPRLTFLDLSGFNLSGVKNSKAMFNGCTKLTTIVCADGTDMRGATSADNTYNNCTSLVGKCYSASGAVVGQRAYDSSQRGKTYSKACTTKNDGYLTPATKYCSYEITYHINDGSAVDTSTSTSCMLKSAVGSYATVAGALWSRLGYHATGWNTAPDGSGSALSFDESLTAGNEPAASTTLDLYLMWEPNTYDVRFDANGGRGSADPQTGIAYADGVVTMPGNAFSRDGYDLAGWALTPTATEPTWLPGESAGQLSYVSGDELTLYAVWAGPKSFDITFDANVEHGGASITPTSGFTTLSSTQVMRSEAYGSKYILPSDPTPASDYYFAGWYTKPVDGIRVSDTTLNSSAGPVTLYAQYGRAQDYYVILSEPDADGWCTHMTFTADASKLAGLTSDRDIIARDGYVSDQATTVGGVSVRNNGQEVDYFISNTSRIDSWDNGNSTSAPWWKQAGSGSGNDKLFDTRTIIGRVKKITFDPTFKDVQPRSIALWFNQFQQLTTFENMPYLNTSYTQSFDFAFGTLAAMNSLDLTSLDMSSATTAECMFRSNPTLTSINLSGVNMSSVRNMYRMFEANTNLTSLNLTGVVASSVENAGLMFVGTSKLKTIDLSGFDLSTITDARGMFGGCSQLRTILCSDTSSQIPASACANSIAYGSSSYYAFTGCSNLTGTYYSPSTQVTSTFASHAGEAGNAQVNGTYAKARTLSREGYLSPLTRYNSYDFVYHLNSEDGDATSVVSSPLKAMTGSYATISAPLWNNPGYKALSWNTKPDGSGTTYEFGQALTASNEPAGSSSTDLYLQWKPNTYVLTLNNNGGAGSVNSKEYGYNNSESHEFKTEIKLPTWSRNGIYRDGYTLLGWSLSDTKTEPDPGFEAGATVSRLTRVDGDEVTLYAVWRINAYELDVDLNGADGAWTAPAGFVPGATAGTYARTDVDFGSTVTLPDPTREGYEFAGWEVTDAQGTAVATTVADGSGSSTVTMGSGNASVKATWRVAAPQAAELTYSSHQQTVIPAAPGYTLGAPAPTGSTSSTAGYGVDATGAAYVTDAGTYAVVATLSDAARSTGAMWADGTTSDRVIEFEVRRLSIDDVDISVDGATFTGFEQRPHPSVTYTDAESQLYVLREGTDYSLTWRDNVHAGTATVCVTAIPSGNFTYANTTGSQEATFQIAPRSLASPGEGASVVFQAIPDQTYSGSAAEPAPSLSLVTEAGTYEIPRASYTASWANNVEVTRDASGQVVAAASVTATAADGDLLGAASSAFKIVPMSIADALVELDHADKSYDFEGQPLSLGSGVNVARVQLDVGGSPRVLEQGRDWNASLDEVTATGNYDVVVTGVGNYEGTARSTIAVVAKAYDVDFDANGGSFGGASSTSVTQAFGQAWALPATAPELAGFTFAGYYDANGATPSDPYGEAEGAPWGNVVDATTVVGRLSEGARLFARWTRNSYAATFEADHGATIDGGTAAPGGRASVAFEGSVPAGVTVDTGAYTFLGWAYRMTCADGSVSTGMAADYASVSVTGDVTFTARLVETVFVSATATDGLVGVGAEAKADAPSSSAERLSSVSGQRIAFAPIDDCYELVSVTATDLAAPGESAHTATLSRVASSFELGGATYAYTWTPSASDANAGTIVLGTPGVSDMSLSLSFTYAPKRTTFKVKAYVQSVAGGTDLSSYVEDPSLGYESGEVDAGSTISVVPPVAEGLAFVSSFVESPAYANTSTARADGTTIVDLYYDRVPCSWTARFVDASGNSVADPAGGTAPFGATLGLASGSPDVVVTPPDVAGYASTTATNVTLSTGANELLVTYAAGAFPMTVDPNGGTWSQTGFAPAGDGTYASATDVTFRESVTLSRPERAGYTFAGWRLEGTGASVAGDVVVQGSAASRAVATWVVATPTATSRTYNESAQVVVASAPGIDLAIAPVTGSADGASTDASRGALATHAGTYDVTASLSASDHDVTWEDGSVAEKIVRATVERASNSWATPPSCASVSFGTAPAPQATPALPSSGASVSFAYAPLTGDDWSDAAPTEVGTYRVRATLEGTDDYAGLEGTATFAVTQLVLTADNVQPIAEQGFTGQPVTPPVVVTNAGATLALGSDYEVSFADNVNVGVARAIVRGKGSYAGEVSVDFEIGRAKIARPEARTLVYNGAEQVGVAASTGFDLALTAAPDGATGCGVYWLDGSEIGSAYATTAGTYQVTATLDDNHEWDDGSRDPVVVTFRVAPFDISGGSLAEVAPLSFTGEEQRPAPALLVDYTGDLVFDQVNEGRDYDLTWSDNVNAGQASVTATGTGNFTGQVSRAFTISAVPVTLSISGSTTGKTYDGTASTDPAFTVSVAAPTDEVAAAATAALAPMATRMDVTGSSPSSSQDAGTYVIRPTYTPDDNYDVTVIDGAMTIARRRLAVAVTDATKTYGDATPQITGTVTGTYAPGQSATSIGLTYACDTPADADAGTYGRTLTASCTDANYELDVTPGTLTVNPRALSDSAVTATLTDGTWDASANAYAYTFTGADIVPSPHLALAASAVTRDLGEGDMSDYTATLLGSGSAAVDAIRAAGSYTLRLQGQGSFSGTRDLRIVVRNATATATFDANGGSFAGGSATATLAQEYSAAWSLPASPDRTYTKGDQEFRYTFAGWWTRNGAADGDWGERVEAGATCPLTADATLYAKWETSEAKVGYTVRHFVQGLSDAPGYPTEPTYVDEMQGIPGDEIDVVARDAEGHALATTATTYADSAHGAQAAALLVAEDGSSVVSLYYDLVSLDVRWVVDGAQFAQTSELWGATATAPAGTPERAGGLDYSYSFAGWLDESGNAFDNQELPVRSDITYFASFTGQAASYDVTLDANGGRLADGQQQPATVAFGESLELLEPVNEHGWTFAGWVARAVDESALGDPGEVVATRGATSYVGGTTATRLCASWRVSVPTATSLTFDGTSQTAVAAGAGYTLGTPTPRAGTTAKSDGVQLDGGGNALVRHAGTYDVSCSLGSASLPDVDATLLAWEDGSTSAASVPVSVARAANAIESVGTDPASPIFGDPYQGVATATWSDGAPEVTWGATATGTFGSQRPTAAGTYYVRAQVPVGDDWEAAEATVPFTIQPATIALATVSSAPATYNGFAQPPAVTVSIGSATTLVAGRDYEISYFADAALTQPLASDELVAAGTYYVRADGLGNYAPAEGADASFAVGTYAIAPAPLQLVVADGGVATRPYDGTTDVTSQVEKSALSLSGAVAGERPTLDAAVLAATLDAPGVGDRTATVTGVALAAGNPANANYRIAAGEGGAQATASCKVDPRELSVSGLAATPRAYDGTTVVEVTGTPVLSGEVAGETVGLADAPLSGTLDSAGSGDRTATVSGLALDPAAPANANYALPTVTLPVAISRRPVSVEGVSVESKTYDGTTSATASVSGVTFPGSVAGDELALDGSKLSAAFVSPGAGDAVAATVTGLALDAALPSSANYELTAATASTAAAIAPAELVVRPHASSAPYGSEPACEGYDLEGFVAGEDRASAGVSGEPTFSFTCNAGSDAGDYVVSAQVDGLSAPNYRFTGAQAEFRVVPADITWDPPVGVSPARPVYGDVYTAVGTPSFGEATFVFSSTPTFSPTSTSTTPPTTVGTYYVRGTVAGSANWNAGQQVASFTIAPATFDEATVAVEPLTYTGEALQPQVSVRIGTQPPLSADTDYTLTFFADAAGAQKIDPATDVVDAGTYYVQATGRGNYDGTATAIQPFTVDQADSMAVGLAGYAGTYDGAAHALSADVTGVDARSSALTVVEYQVGEGAWSTDAPSFTATTDGDVAVRARATNPNYKTHTSADATVRIDRAAVTVTADGKSKVFGQEDPDLTATVTGLVGADSVDYELTRDVGEDVGTYVIHATGERLQGSYEVTLADGTLTIDSAVARIPSALVGLVFDGTSQLGVDFDDALCVAEGERATDAGEHVATVRLLDPGNIVWEDLTIDPADAIEVAYAVAPADIAQATIAPIADQVETGEPLEPALDVTALGRTLVAGVDYEAAYESNVGVGTATVTISGTGNWTGTAQATFKVVPDRPDAIPMFRLYNPYSGEHFYTASPGEREFLSRVGWNYEGVGWWAPIEGGEPVYRLYNPYGGDHHYTPSPGERDALVAAGWNYEGVGWRSAGDVPVLRQYNPYAASGTHNFTTSEAENDMLVRNGWNFEGVGWMAVMAG
ncbi:InlB B-repeat-containing protein [Olsenella intestinalis]|uniref:InlB B-repeat-containing protein n=1 Tax=Olsenella intestinalis TaxID=2930083 RepID=UPI00200DF664